ncbi:hypothetical protein OG883_13600 [Streptomyces sp. NBC_01142]|uniref:hypothetical protein n=1 Tax=Streptomyces sp. NBC_01142 TaxID=2975865 RepID=UPI00224E6568|nr:hypothetical protein [Streptomyces sp. NBC_01142]MCX4820925.1 hypothetical protein [Streptomyces sp. NBC_01142]
MSDPERRFSVRIRVQLALIAVVAAAVLLATWQFSEASGTYQDAVRQDVKRQAAVLEDIRYVYGDEAPLALRVAASHARADGLEAVKGQGRVAASEHTLAAQTAFSLRRAAEPGSLLGNGGYRHQDLGYDLPRRLADVQRRTPELYDVDPGATLRAGDRQVAWGLACAAVAVAAVLLAVVTGNVVRPRRWRRTPAPGGPRVLRAVEIIPQPAVTTRNRRAAQLHLFVFAMLLLLPLGQILAAGNEQRAQAEAARRAVQLSTSITAHGQRTAFLTEGLRAAEAAALQATAREFASLETGVSPQEARHEQTVAIVENVIAQQVRKIVDYMGRPPTATDGVDPAAVAALGRAPERLSNAQAEQVRQVDLAERASRRALFLASATAVAVVAEALAATALTTMRRAWWFWLAGTSGVTLLLVSFALVG